MLCLVCLISAPVSADQARWGQLKDKHFVIYYEERGDAALAAQVLRKAEEYYAKIGSHIGYTRTNQFWTWDERVKIFLFHTQDSFMRSTGQPAWSTGYADRDSRVFKSRTIVTFRQETEFLDGLLPHEVSHLILHDFIKDSPIPVWFDEGVAQLQERGKSAAAQRIMQELVGDARHVPFSIFSGLDIRQENDPVKARVFYAQSLSVVDFLVKRFGAESLATLCRNLRDGKDFEKSLSDATRGNIKNYADLEFKWSNYLKMR